MEVRVFGVSYGGYDHYLQPHGVLRGGVVTASDVDAAGRTTREWRLGTDDSEMTLRRM